MSNAYRAVIQSGGGAVGDATAADVLTGKTFSGAVGSGVSGTMPNNGAVSQNVAPGQSYTVPAGYHNGSGSVTGGYLVGAGKYRSGYSTSNAVFSLTESDITGDAVSVSVPANNQGFVEINVSEYSQVIITDNNPVMNIHLIGSTVSKAYYLESSATAQLRTIDLTGVDILNVSHRVSGSATTVLGFTFS